MFSNFYLTKIAEINADRYHKIPCLFDILNCNFKKHFSAREYNIDETIVPYLGKHGPKQFIRSKPICFDFKLLCLTSTDGYLFHAEPYCEADTKLSDVGLGQGADVASGFAKKGSLLNGFSVNFHKLFTYFLLRDELLKDGIGSLVTIRQKY